MEMPGPSSTKWASPWEEMTILTVISYCWRLGIGPERLHHIL